MKVKYQVRGTERSIRYYQEHLKISREVLERKKYPLGLKLAQEDFHCALHMSHMATHPADKPNKFTTQEIEALHHLHRENCGSTPQLLDCVGDFPAPGLDAQQMVDGYAIFILMTKVPGEPLEYEKFWQLSMSERDEIRASFKEALIDVYNNQICPEDAAMRNLLWDQQTRKCYIVDFEDYYIANSDNGPLEFENYQYRCWELAEECFTGRT